MARNVKTISICVPSVLADRLAQLAQLAGISKSSYITMLLYAALYEKEGGCVNVENPERN